MSEASFGAVLYYRKPKEAIDWLTRAFGFERTLFIDGPDGDEHNVHAEMGFGNGFFSLGGEWNESTRSPASLGGANTQSMEVRIETDIDEHCNRARAAGAVITQEPQDEFWGDRRYRAVDLEGHVWSFAQHIRDVSHEQAEQSTGLKNRRLALECVRKASHDPTPSQR